MPFVLAFGALDMLAFGAPTPNAAFVLAFGALDVLAFGAPTWMCWRSGPRPGCVGVRGPDPERHVCIGVCRVCVSVRSLDLNVSAFGAPTPNGVRLMLRPAHIGSAEATRAILRLSNRLRAQSPILRKFAS